MKKATKLIVGALLGLALLCGFVYADNITLNWSPPTLNSDATPIVDLASFNVYARSDTNFVQGADITTNLSDGVVGSPTMGDAYAVQLDIPEGTWLTVTAVDTSGNESGFAVPVQYADGAVFDIPEAPTQLYITKP